MAETRKDPGHLRRRNRHFFYFLVFMALFFGVVSRIHILDLWLYFLAGLTSIFLLVVRIKDDFMVNIYRCPECGKTLYPNKNTERARMRDGERITFYCDDCDIVWDIGEDFSSD